jgi:nitrogen fixation/metabolism regulation signal transduction histidine kinase
VVLPESTQEGGGVVVVFDDITNLIQAQRDAAWGEVARRLAHEIKNPLTPIQLSAERLRHKYLPMMSGDDADVLNRATNTIVQQVESMKMMVKEFSEYARSPKLVLAPVVINDLVNDVLELYRAEGGRLQVRALMDPALTTIEADAGRLRQLLHNLIKNAIEAMTSQAEPRLEVRTLLQRTPELQAAELIIEDNGSGVPPEMIDKLFEPYVSTKPKGSGLGLAIVKKIVEEHNGVIWVEQGVENGARFIIRLPLQQTPRMDDADARPRVIE